MTADPSWTLHGLQIEILDAMAAAGEFEAVLTLLCRRVEALTPDIACSIIAVNEKQRLRSNAGPSLPTQYRDLLARLPDDWLDRTEFVTGGNPARDPEETTNVRPRPPSELALPSGWAASWSSAVKAPTGQLVALFTMYFHTERSPSRQERMVAETCVRLLRIGIDRWHLQQRNQQLRRYDQLTNLQNRRRFNAVIESKVADESRSFALLLVEIEHLKTINHTMGHVVGDQVLREVAARLERVASISASTFRIGGDEFAVLADDIADHAELRDFASRILDAMHDLFQCRGNTIAPQVTIGGVVREMDGDSPDLLHQNADFALLHAKETHRGGYVAFEPGLRTSVMRRTETIREIALALTEHRIVTYYQPIVRLDTEQIVGLEALARLRTKDGRIASAGEFADAFTDPHVADRLTNQMLSQVAADIRTWLDDGIPFQHVGVNLAMSDFRHRNLDQTICAAFDAQQVSLQHLVLEVTETVFMDGPNHDVARAVTRLRDKGMLVALDDFGTGFASLTHLLSFPVDVIKIDKSFIDRLLTDAPSRVIVEALIDISAKLGMRTVAEGIECAAQAKRLSELGCRLGQGFHFARPADAARTTALLQQRAQRDHQGQSPA
ncbi:putative bifunctional diguanylate cyclase/phosphodiesterase [Aurantimonas sp. A3-2-R12]|uniref:putative bifunctional diguanylate cyclase/phosphodiesterase n=1 Tax=Aurantimonas sp. A3-2-R12 TaxID=3114362 RepID=UPI002E173974|nr:bifunctional diguanylate cyclase/phosphodiesterase [Aurantimonas sp. A3-2-R12]